MKKYIHITIVLGAFFLIVWWRQSNSSEQAPILTVPTPSNQNTPTAGTSSALQATPTTGASSSQYKDGTYTGSVEDAYYGNIQVQAIISGGKIADVQFLQYPNDNRTSLSINTQAMPLLKSEAISSQKSQVDVITGASDSSQAFQRSLASALQQAH